MPSLYCDVSQRALEAAAIRRDGRRRAGGNGNSRRNSGVYSRELAGGVPVLESGKR
jgi:hypothetical protein